MKTNGLFSIPSMGHLSFFRLFLVLFFGSFVWGGSLVAQTYHVFNWSSGVNNASARLVVTPISSGVDAGKFTVTVDNKSYNGAYGGFSFVGVGIAPDDSMSPIVSRVYTVGTHTFRFVAATTSNYQYTNVLETRNIVFAEPTQIVSLSPSSGNATILAGGTFSGTASGSQASNPYNISILTGGGSASINSSTGSYTVTAPSSAGILQYRVWISAGSGYTRSDDVIGTITVSPAKEVRVTVPANKGAFDIIYKIMQGSSTLSTFVQPAGAGPVIASVDVPASGVGPVILVGQVQGAAKDDNGNWVVSEGAVTDLSPSPPLPQTDKPPSGSPPTPPTTPPPVPNPGTPVPSNVPAPRLVWSAGTQSTDPMMQKDLLSNATFREGVQHISDGLKSNSELFWEKLIEEKEKAPSIISEETSTAALFMNEAKEAAMESASELSSVFDNLTNNDPITGIPTGNVQTSVPYAVRGVGGAMTSFQFSLNPFDAINASKMPPWLFQLVDLSRLIIAWTAIGMFFLDLMKKIRLSVLGVLQVNREGEFAVERKVTAALGGIPLAGGFIGSAAAMALRVTIFAVFATVILSLPATLTGIFDGFSSLGYNEYKDQLSQLISGGGPFSVIMGMATRVIPIATLVAIFINRILAETLINGAVLPVAMYIKLFRM